MDIEAIKEWRNDIVSDLDLGLHMLSTDVDRINWLITELEKKRDVDLQSVLAYDAAEKATARSCAEIAYRVCAETRHITLADKCVDSIMKEFNLEQ